MNLFVEKVKNLDAFDKLSIYLDYCIVDMALRRDFYFVDTLKIDWEIGYGMPHKMIGNLGLYYPWKNLKTPTFEEFISDDNIKVSDFGDSWESHGLAQRVRIDLTGIYDWAMKINYFN